MSLELDLTPDEKILWSGKPDPSALFTRQDAFLIPFTLAWAAFAVFWLVMATLQAHNVFAIAFGAIFVVIGLYISIVRFFVKTYWKRRTLYTLTNRRAIIKRGGTERSVFLVPGVPIETRTRGRLMDVIFGQSSAGVTMNMGAIWANSGLDFLPGMPTAFYDVTDVLGLTSALPK